MLLHCCWRWTSARQANQVFTDAADAGRAPPQARSARPVLRLRQLARLAGHHTPPHSNQWTFPLPYPVTLINLATINVTTATTSAIDSIGSSR